MELHLVIRQVLIDNTHDIISEERFVNMLADYRCFEKARYLRSILRDMIESKFIVNLHSINFSDPSWEVILLQRTHSFLAIYAYREEVVSYIVECLLFGFGVIYDVEYGHDVTDLVDYVKTHLIGRCDINTTETNKSKLLREFVQSLLISLEEEMGDVDDVKRVIDDVLQRTLGESKDIHDQIEMGKSIFDLWENKPISRRVFPLIILIDCPSTLEGELICTINDAMNDFIALINELSNENLDAQYKIAVMTFSSTTRWMYDRLIEAENFIWQPCQTNPLTHSFYDKAFNDLNYKLCRKELLSNSEGGFYPPSIFLFSASKSINDYKSSLENLKRNNWFKYATKIAVPIGSEYDEEMLVEFTGTKEAIIRITETTSLRELLKPIDIVS